MALSLKESKNFKMALSLKERKNFKMALSLIGVQT